MDKNISVYSFSGTSSLLQILTALLKYPSMTVSIGSVNREDSEDQLEKLMKHTGCLELHYKVQECIAETRDWRKCQSEVQNFRKCMESFKAKEGKA